MLHDYCSGRVVFVAKRVCFALAHFAHLCHQAVAHQHVGNTLRLAGLLSPDVESQVDGIRNQPFFAGADGIEDPFTGEGLVLQHAKTAAIQG